MKRKVLKISIETDKIADLLDNQLASQVHNGTGSIFDSPIPCDMHIFLFSPIAEKLRVGMYHPMYTYLVEKHER